MFTAEIWFELSSYEPLEELNGEVQCVEWTRPWSDSRVVTVSQIS